MRKWSRWSTTGKAIGTTLFICFFISTYIIAYTQRNYWVFVPPPPYTIRIFLGDVIESILIFSGVFLLIWPPSYSRKHTLPKIRLIFTIIGLFLLGFYNLMITDCPWCEAITICTFIYFSGISIALFIGAMLEQRAERQYIELT